MTPGEDALRDELANSPSPNSGEERQTDFDDPDTKSAWKRTFEKNTYFFYNDEDNELEKNLKARSESGRKRGTDDLPKNVGNGKFPVALIEPTIDGLGDWRQNVPPNYGPYPNIDAKSGFTKQDTYPDEISKKNFKEEKLKFETQPIGERIKTKKLYFNNFEDYAGKQFLHLLDYFSDQKNGLGKIREIPTDTYTQEEENGVKVRKTVPADTSKIHLGSFIKTFDDNEDPTYLGYDIKIKQEESPLFNGTVQSFINQFSGYGNSEIAARAELYEKFKEQFLRFLKTDIDSNSPRFNGGNGAKTYYLKKIGGLDKLVEAIDSDKGESQFVKYGEDFITLSFNEDVSQNLGYLASLYKALSWSRFRGKLILPPNILRFDAEIEITEVRKFNRVIKDVTNNNLEFIADKFSKYVYTLYECQFFFPSLPHGESLDMSDVKEITEYEIKFNYKFATLKFSKLTYDTGLADNPVFSEFNIDNAVTVPTAVQTKNTNNAEIENGSINPKPKTVEPKPSGGVDTETQAKKDPPAPQEGSELEQTRQADAKRKLLPATPTAGLTDTTNTSVTGGSIGGTITEQISKSSIQTALKGTLSKISPNLAAAASRLEQIDLATTFPQVKGFAQGILGGEIAKVAGEFISKPNDFLTKKLNDVASSIISPLTKGFNLNIVGGQIGGALGSIAGNVTDLVKGSSLSSVTSRLNDVFSATVAPKVKGFAQGILGGELAKTSGIFESLGKPETLLNKLSDVASSVISPSKKGFNLNIIGGQIAGALGDIGGNVSNLLKGASLSKITSKLTDVFSATVAPQSKGFIQNLLGGELVKSSGIFKQLPKANEIVSRLSDVASSTIAPLTKNFNLGMIGKSLSGSGQLTKSLLSPEITKKFEQVTNSLINPKNKGFSLDIVGGLLGGGGDSSLPGSSSKKSSAKNALNETKNNIINSGISTISKSLTSQASLLNKTLGNILNQKGPVPNAIKSQLNERNLNKTINFVGKSLKSFFTK